MGENIYKSCVWYQVNIQDNEELLQFNNNTNKISQFLKWPKDLNRHFSKEDTQMATKHVKNAQDH